MKKVIVLNLIILLACSCNVFKYADRGDLSVENFKTEIPFKVLKEMAIAVPLKVDNSKESYIFHFDTHDPESCYSSASPLTKNKHVTYLGSSSLKVSTTSGEKIDREYYNVDSIFIGNIVVTNAALLKIPEKQDLQDTVYPHMDGILGLNLLRKGIWKIDFQANIITFTSSMDSLSDVNDKLLFAESNLFDIFNVQTTFNGLQKKLAVDLGTNAGVFLPLEDMKQLSHFGQAEIRNTTKKTAAGISAEALYRLPQETISLNNQQFTVKVAGSSNQRDGVIGLAFFRQFRYIILDYPGRKMYVSKAIGNPPTAKS